MPNYKLYTHSKFSAPRQIPITFNNISNYHKLPESKWLEDGWVEYSDNPPEHNSKIQNLIKLGIENGERQYQVVDYSFEDIKNRVIKLLAQKRYEREISGISLNGMPIKTDRESTALINGAFSYVMTQDDNVTINFKTDMGFVLLSKEQIIGISIAVAQHIQAQFNWEKELVDQINDAEDIEDLIEIEDQIIEEE